MAEHTLDILPDAPGPQYHCKRQIVDNPLGHAHPGPRTASGSLLEGSELAVISPTPSHSPPSSPHPASFPPCTTLSSPSHSSALSSSLCFQNISYSVSIRRHPLAFLPNAPSCSPRFAAAQTDACEISGNADSQLHQPQQQQQQHRERRRNILQGISGRAMAGQVTAIMGASGSGKTSLLDILSHRISLPSKPHHVPSTARHLPSSSSPGPLESSPPSLTPSATSITPQPSVAPSSTAPPSVTLNGAPVTASTMRRVSAYVMQDDLLFPALTVRETLLFAAELRLPAGVVGRREKEEKVEELMLLLGLTKVADSRIGDENRRGVSGGERKRVAIGVEMMGDPQLLFLDEPTSGLDSTCAFHVVKAVRDVAVLRQSIVLMVLHQPSFRVLNLIDNLLLLGSGHMMFSGCPSELPAYLTDFGCPPPPFSNAAEFALDLIQSLQMEGQEVTKETNEEEQHKGGKEGGESKVKAKLQPQSHTGGAETCGILQLAAFHREWVTKRSAEGQVKGMRTCEQEGTGCDPSVVVPLSSESLSSVISKSGRRSRSSSESDEASLELVTSSSHKSTGSRSSSSSTSIDSTPSSSTSSSSSTSPVLCTSSSIASSQKAPEEQRGAMGERKYANGWWRELFVLTKRSAIVIRRTPALYLLRLLLIMLTGLLIASLFWQPEYNAQGVHERLAFIAFLTCTLFFSSGDATPLFIQERNIFIRETTHNAYRPSTYMVSSTLVYLPLHLLMSLAITLECWWCLRLTGGAAGLTFMVLVCFCCLFTGNAIATFVSATVNNVILAYAIVITILANFALVCGFYIERSSIPPYWIWLHYISPLKYAYEALALNEFDRDTDLCYLSGRDIYSSTPISLLLDDVDVQRSLISLRPALIGSQFADVSTSTCLQTGPELAAYALGLTQLDKWECVLVLFFIGLVLRLAHFVLLTRLCRATRH